MPLKQHIDSYTLVTDRETNVVTSEVLMCISLSAAMSRRPKDRLRSTCESLSPAFLAVTWGYREAFMFSSSSVSLQRFDSSDKLVYSIL